MAKLYLIDAYNLIYRCCLAKAPRLTGPSGEPTSGTYFFTKSLLKLCNEKPDCLAFCLDAPRKTLFRRSLDQTYKAKRSEPPEDLVTQARRCIEITSKLGISTLSCVGFEADDIIATIVTKFQNEIDCVIISSDKDLHQLINDKVTMFDMLKDCKISKTDVEEKWGVPPEKIPEIQILMGDSADGIKGVEGIGKKKALDLIQRFGTADLAKGNAKDLNERVRLALDKTNLDTLRRLVTLVKDVPIETTLKDLAFTKVEINEEAKNLFRSLGFSRWAK